MYSLIVYSFVLSVIIVEPLVDCDRPFIAVYCDGGNCKLEIIEVHSVQSTMMGDLNMWVDYRGPLSTVYNDGEISTCV